MKNIDGESFIVYCPTHAAVIPMLKYLKEYHGSLVFDYKHKDRPDCCKLSKLINTAEIRQAEGKD